MHFGDYTFIFLLALVLFGPKKLPEIGKQLGKLLAEFRRASNEFKFQIQEELRNMEEEERRKKLAEQQAALTATTLAAEPAPQPTLESQVTPSILPPSTGTQVSGLQPYAVAIEPAEPTVTEPMLTGTAGTETGKADTTADPQSPEPPASTEFSGVDNATNQAHSQASTEPVTMTGVESTSPGVHHG